MSATTEPRLETDRLVTSLGNTQLHNTRLPVAVVSGTAMAGRTGLPEACWLGSRCLAAVADQRKAERLAKGLYMAMQKARAKMVKEYEKLATSLENAVDKKSRRRRRSKKKAVAKS